MKYIKNKGKKCSVKKCQKDAVCRGKCYKHYQQMRLRGEIRERVFIYIDGICENIGCGCKLFARGLCQKCYLKQKGKENGR